MTCYYVRYTSITYGRYLRMGLLSDMWNCGLRMRRECRERFPRRRRRRKTLVSDPGMHHGTSQAYMSQARAVMHVGDR